MSNGWCFDSFSLPALEQLFAGPADWQRERLLELGGEAASRALAKGRLDYDALAPREAAELDQLVVEVFADEALRRSLAVAPETIDPLGPAQAEELAHA